MLYVKPAYVIVPGDLAGKESHVAIGPFSTQDEATQYLTASQSEKRCAIRRLVSPLADPSDDADLHT